MAIRQRATKRATLALALSLALSLALGGCAGLFADPARIAAGTPVSQIVATLGQPTARYALPSGGQRLQYAAERRVYNVDLDAQGRAVRVEQALDERLFAQRIAPGHWTRDDVLREYGPPMRQMTVRNFDGLIFVWRYDDVLAEPYLLYIDVDRGGIVRGYSTVDERLLWGRGNS
jgi:hypothetical protein